MRGVGLCAALLLAAGVVIVSAQSPGTAAVVKASNNGFADVMKVAANMTVQLLVLDEKFNEKAVSGRVTKQDVAAFSAQEDVIVDQAVAQLRAIPGLTGGLRAEAMGEFNKAAYNILNETRTRWNKVQQGDVSTARWFKSPAADAKRVQLMGAWRKGNVEVLQALTGLFAAGKLKAEDRAAYLARADAATKRLQADIAAIPGVTPAEKQAAAKKVAEAHTQSRAQLDNIIKTLLNASGIYTGRRRTLLGAVKMHPQR